MKDCNEWMQGHEAESGDQRRAVTGVQVGVTELEVGLEQWDGEEGGWEKTDSLRIAMGRDDYAATRCGLLRPTSTHFHPSSGH